ncbi:hypothetical protein AMAG_08516 [Allomyces macrogynus ATCC 38327]|uniref:Rab-GAP TBC domain-containing protein n=1 Tax=Allomyces macrogynus (strain ATCC 38327) TaxID=578462 RepID=A0A0L0SLP8_ALLM3|nr:hypothetical protein, variant 1 [Allomyces macrogynus ATCC 38327]KNE63383.1 hypothetical protein AMAG_08516 [Allomyces macrogynus ATCC 38327]|eukprot:KNE63382.1 hypothetical protein, variant 1 [Allomyces macrogynus ATCC 38327]
MAASVNHDHHDRNLDLEIALDRQDLATIRAIGIARGFRTTALRQRAWPLLLRCANGLVHLAVDPPAPPSEDAMAETRFEDQVRKDVHRSFVHFSDVWRDPSDEQGGRPRLQAQLHRMLITVLAKFPFLHYYQGFHDICTVLLLVLGEHVATHALQVLALYFLRDAMHRSNDPALAQMRIILPILKHENKAVFDLFQDVELEPHFCFGWVTTWFAAIVRSFDDVCRLFDLFLSCNPILPVYLAAAIVLDQAEELLEHVREFDIVYASLLRLPQYDSIEPWIATAHELFAKYPIASIQGSTGWAFDENCAALRWDSDFPADLHRPAYPAGHIPVLMHLTATTAVADHDRNLEAALDRHDLAAVRSIGIAHGFRTTAYRRRAWPLLLRCTPDLVHPAIDLTLPLADDFLPETPFDEQVRKDVRRSFVHFADVWRNPHDEHGGKPKLQTQLYHMVVRVLAQFPFLHYYQGLHDICTVLLLVLGERMGTYAAQVLAVYYLRDAMHESLHPTMAQMRILLPILKNENKAVFELFQEIELEPHFCLSWITTWFAHDLRSFDDVCRLFDFFLSSNPILPVYVAAAIILDQTDELLEQDREFDFVYAYLSRLPPYESIEHWIATAHRLFKKYPIPGIQGITGWAFDDNCAALRWDRDFPASLRRATFPVDDVPSLMQSTSTALARAGGDTPYGFTPRPLVLRVVRAGYVPVEGDGRALLLITAVAIGILSMGIGMIQHHDAVAPAAAVAVASKGSAEGLDVLRRVLVSFLRG